MSSKKCTCYVLSRHTCCRSDSVCRTCCAEVADSCSVAALALLIASASAVWDCVSRLCRWTNSSSSAAYMQVSTDCNLTSILQTNDQASGDCSQEFQIQTLQQCCCPQNNCSQITYKMSDDNRSARNLLLRGIPFVESSIRQQRGHTCIRT